MTAQTHVHTCFNCNRSENEIPVIAWRYQENALWICSECMPNLIHKWHLIAAKISGSGAAAAGGET